MKSARMCFTQVGRFLFGCKTLAKRYGTRVQRFAHTKLLCQKQRTNFEKPVDEKWFSKLVTGFVFKYSTICHLMMVRARDSKNDLIKQFRDAIKSSYPGAN